MSVLLAPDVESSVKADVVTKTSVELILVSVTQISGGWSPQ
jgi:hypothetical protein